MSNENERQEYVLNENGIIFVGNARYIEARGWFYGQVSHKEFVWTHSVSYSLYLTIICCLYNNCTNLGSLTCGLLPV